MAAGGYGPDKLVPTKGYHFPVRAQMRGSRGGLEGCSAQRSFPTAPRFQAAEFLNALKPLKGALTHSKRDRKSAAREAKIAFHLRVLRLCYVSHLSSIRNNHGGLGRFVSVIVFGRVVVKCGRAGEYLQTLS
eukprot:1194961-Prorocentrum_minimum.AAC.1